MKKYLLKRLWHGIITILFISTATFFAMHMVPGDPLSSEKAITPETRKALEAEYGIDKPLAIQYGIFLKKTFIEGDLGFSYTNRNTKVNDIIANHFPVSAKLGLLAIFFATTGAIMWGAIAAKYRNRLPDYTSMILVILFISVPSFVFASGTQLLIVKLNAATGWNLPYRGTESFVSQIVPAMILGLGTMAFLTRIMRSSLLEVIHSDYIRTARAKGLSPKQIFFSHELRNAVLPVITIIGPAIAAITTGSFVIETIFTIPGLGKFFVQAVQQNDYTVIMGTTVFYGSFLVLTVLAVDILYGFIDPRIQVEK